MKPIKTAAANWVFNPPPGGDDWCDMVWVERTSYDLGSGQRIPCVKLTYELEPADLVFLNNGAKIVLTIMGEDMPPVMLRPAAAEAAPIYSSSPSNVQPPHSQG